MNENATNITYEKVTKSVDTINDCSSRMKNIFEDFNTTIREVLKDENFSGEASTVFENRYKVLSEKFDSYTNAVKRFAALLQNAGERTKATESNISEEAENLSA